ncbi:hypothetical protein SAMN05428957_103113 [Oryzisolibacter propanilivorax]|uniref:DUF1178 family protein n=1 Tax=Oryzisolibacter propanilivorax TaxID=1527607 RepID=A0A1G9R8Z0_9BURK|nr:DUF1178 family protein [Oryzisolibacter propanilivorax]SDM19762.1 hypothetical protein SAMN05428957_103113 [Oryzisolibacter propanilivorax]
MKVLDLRCTHDHGFEGWFASEADFQDQLVRGLVQCPLCGDAGVRKVLSAPRLNLRSAEAAGESRSPAAPGDEPATAATPHAQEGSMPLDAPARALQAAWLLFARRVVAQTEDVGTRFAAEARRMHHGETEERGIRGQATPQEAAQLLEEGITVLPLLLPEAVKEPLQ